MNKVRRPLILAAVFVAIGLVFQLTLRGYGMLAFCFYCLAALALIYAALGVLKARHEKAARTIWRVIVCVLIIGGIIGVVTEACIIRAAVDAKGEGDMVVVLGAGVNGTVPSRALWSRLNAALAYSEEDPEAVFVLSGGQGPGEDITEAECMRRWLTSKGVDGGRLILEDRSTSTEENLLFTKRLLEGREGGFDGKILIITEGFHILRAQLLAEKLGYTDFSSRAAWNGYPMLTVNYFIREAAAIWFYIFTGKL